jgi:hypothetical protein
MPSCRRVVPALAGVLCVALLAACHSSSTVERLPRPHDLPRTDARARRTLLSLLERGGRATWWVDSAFVRAVGGRTLDGALTEVNRPPDHLVVGLGGLHGTLGGRVLSCTPATGGPLCSGAPVPQGTDTAAYATLTDPDTGPYALRPAPARRIAGISARCYRLDGNGRGAVQPLGTRATACFSDDGIPLALDVERTGGRDTTTARAVRHSFTDADVQALLAPYLGAGTTRRVTTSTTTTATTATPAPTGG